MGLDLYPMGKAKPGHEEEWERLMQTLYDDREESKEDEKRRDEISDRPYEVLGAPRVGEDEEADAWMLKQKNPDSGMSDEEFLQRTAGYYVLDLLVGKCDGVPRYSHGGIFDEIDETSFRGKFLESCDGLLEDDMLLYRAWTQCMPPEEAVEYGKALLASADNPWVEPPPPPPPPPAPEPGFLGRLFGRKPPEPRGPEPPEPPPTEEEIEEMRNILRAAGRWYIFWGERGHPIWAWF